MPLHVTPSFAQMNINGKHNGTSTRDSADRPFIIGVCGGTASGKTTVCALLEEHLVDEHVAMLPSDAFYKELTEEEKRQAYANEYNFDSPASIAFNDLLTSATKLANWEDVEIPQYDFSTHSRKKETTFLKSKPIIIVEGILVFCDPQLRDLCDLKIFVECDADIRLARRLVRDIQERGRDLQGALHQYFKFVKPSFDEWVEPCKRYADVIIPNIGPCINEVAIDVIVQHIKAQLLSIRAKRQANLEDGKKQAIVS
jgi:uridine kinase